MVSSICYVDERTDRRRETVMLLDTGSAVTLLSADVWDKIKPAACMVTVNCMIHPMV